MWVRAFRVITVVVWLCSLASCVNWSDADVAETKRRGDLVRQALEQYRSRTGTFPRELQSLVPTYIDTIPKPRVGRKVWKYETYQGDSDYLLSVAIQSQSEPELHADQIGWTYDTK
jgi:hypothetical protein